MNIIERGRAFLQSLQALAGRSAWDWKRCPACGSRLTIKNGGYLRQPWTFRGREQGPAGATPSVPRLRQVVLGAIGAAGVRGSWYAREFILQCGGSLAARADVVAAHGGVSVFVAGSAGTLAHVAARGGNAAGRTLLSGCQYGNRWLDRAGVAAQASVPGQLQDIAQSEEVGKRHGLAGPVARRRDPVVLLLADSVTGLLWPPVVAEREDQAAPGQRLFERARQAGPGRARPARRDE